MGKGTLPAISRGARPEVDELRMLVRGFDALVDALKADIEKGTYGIVIGDDTTGRIPARIIHSTINDWNREHGLAPIPLVFIQGSSEDSQIPALEKAVEARDHLLARRDPSKRALVVTEGITSGQAIARLGTLLTKRHIDFDVAALDGSRFSRTEKGKTVPRAEVNAFIKALQTVDGLQPLDVYPQCRELGRRLEKQVIPQAELAAVHDALVAHSLTGKSVDAMIRRWDSFPSLRAKTPPPAQQRLKEEIFLAANRKNLGGTYYERMIAHLKTHNVARHDFDRAREILTNYQAYPKEDSGFSPMRNLIDGSRPLMARRSAPSLVDEAGWPRATRLFRGMTNAGSIRDREDLTGVSTVKFSPHPRFEGNSAQRQMLRQVRADIREIASWEAFRLHFASATAPMLVATLSNILDTVGTGLIDGTYRFIVAQSPESDAAAALLASAVNAHAAAHGGRRMPVITLQGSRLPHPPDQIAAFNAQKGKLRGIPQGSRALVLTATMGDLDGVASILERIHDIGCTGDIACLDILDKNNRLAYAQSGLWRPDTRLTSGSGYQQVSEPAARIRRDLPWGRNALAQQLG